MTARSSRKYGLSDFGLYKPVRMPGETDLQFGERIHKLMEERNQVDTSRAQLFGRLARSFGDYGQLRKQKKAPNKEVFYIPVTRKETKRLKNGSMQVPISVESLRAVNNCSGVELTEYIKKIGTHLENGAISQENAEIILDLVYAEINKRLNADSTK